MGTHLIDAFIVSFGLDTKGYQDGVREVTDGNKRLGDQSKKTFDQMEHVGRKAGESIKGVAREVIGLGIAFMGARSITGFLANMATGAASADRFGKTLGMSVKQIWAWRQAMKGVGGEFGEGDAALQAVQNAKNSYRLGQLSPDQQAVYGRLGISGNDLLRSDPGSILSKLSGRAGSMDPTLYASLLQQIGLPQSTIYFLQQGKGSVDKLIKQYEASAADAEKTAKEAEKLQQAMTELNTQVQKALIPVLNQIVPLLTQLVGVLGHWLPGGSDAGTSTTGGTHVAGSGLFEIKRGPVGANSIPAGSHGAESQVYSFLRSKGLAPTQALGITAALWAESRLNPNAVNKQSGAYGLSQLLSKDRVANFKRITGHELRGSTLQQQLEFLWWELNGGDHGGKAVLSERGTGTAAAMISKFLRPAPGYETSRDLQAAGRFISSHQRGSTITIHGGIHVKTAATDAKGIARDLHGALNRRIAIAQTDAMVRP